jgi:hypothetical protein
MVKVLSFVSIIHREIKNIVHYFHFRNFGFACLVWGALVPVQQSIFLCRILGSHSRWLRKYTLLGYNAL